MLDWLTLPLAVALDALLGDPRRMPHLTRGCAGVAQWAEWLLYGERHSRLRGAFFTVVVILSVYTAYVSIFWILLNIHPLLAFAWDILILFQCLAARDLQQHVLAVYHSLTKGDLPEARSALARIVGRDTATLEESGISRAALETTAESLCDGIVAPLFWAALFGTPAALIYRCANTLDSLVGHKDARYRNFGTASARLDDLMNYLPARLCALSLLLPARKPTLKRLREEASRHPSPNAGWSECALAMRLNLKLGGENHYGGRVLALPVFNPEGKTPEPEDIQRGLKQCTAAYARCLCALLILGAFYRKLLI